MNSNPEGAGSRACWFVGAAYEEGDQTSRFLDEGIWENGYEDRYLDDVKSVQPGDRIAIKSSYTRKYNLPFDNLEQTVKGMRFGLRPLTLMLLLVRSVPNYCESSSSPINPKKSRALPPYTRQRIVGSIIISLIHCGHERSPGGQK